MFHGATKGNLQTSARFRGCSVQPQIESEHMARRNQPRRHYMLVFLMKLVLTFTMFRLNAILYASLRFQDSRMRAAGMYIKPRSRQERRTEERFFFLDAISAQKLIYTNIREQH